MLDVWQRVHIINITRAKLIIFSQIKDEVVGFSIKIPHFNSIFFTFLPYRCHFSAANCHFWQRIPCFFIIVFTFLSLQGVKRWYVSRKCSKIVLFYAVIFGYSGINSYLCIGFVTCWLSMLILIFATCKQHPVLTHW